MSPTQSDWESLIFGSYSASEILPAVRDDDWQVFRGVLVGATDGFRFAMLKGYVEARNISPEERALRHIRVTNYVNSLKRGGLIK